MPRDPAPTVVIVHGAWADATSWREVIALLHVKGLSVIAVQNPLSALADDVDAVTRVINRQPGPVVLVGHGYGGTVITQAGNHAIVAALVYVAACAPDVNESTMDVEKDGPSPPLVSRFEVDAGWVSVSAVGGCAGVPRARFDRSRGQGPRRRAATHSCQRSSRSSDRRRLAYQALLYAVTDEDRIISPALQREIAARIGARVQSLRAGHLPFLSKPKETAEVILAAVEFVRGKWPGQ